MTINFTKCFIVTSLTIFLSACRYSSETSVTYDCEVREYLEQALDLTSSSGSRLTPSMTNFSAFQHNSSPWLITGFVKRQNLKTLRLDDRSVDNPEKLNSNTSFLIVYANEGFKPKNLLSNYFKGKYRSIDFNKMCPIYVGERNGSFALATLRAKRSLEGKDVARECDVVASLVYFGFPDDKLSQYEDFIEPGVLPHLFEYKAGKISAYLSEYTGCETSLNASSIEDMKSQAESGSVDTQAKLGLIYALGEIVERDDIEAIKWFKKASEQGHADSQFNLGVSYRFGSGVPKDLVKSYIWNSLAASQGHEDARIVKNELEIKMTKSDISEAQKLSTICFENQYRNCD